MSTWTGPDRPPMIFPDRNQLAAFALHGSFSHVPQTRQGHHLSPGSMGQEPWIGRRGCSKHGRRRSQGHPIKDYSGPHKLVFSRGWARRWAPSGPGELSSSLRPRCSRPGWMLQTRIKNRLIRRGIVALALLATLPGAPVAAGQTFDEACGSVWPWRLCHSGARVPRSR